MVAPWQGSHRFPELTYVREELTGSYKARKYISLLPWIVEQGFQRVRIQGSSHSGNVTQLALLLKERGIEPVYMLEGREGPPAGNVLLSKLILGDNYQATETPDVDWCIPEGGSCPAALAGSLGIAGSLIQQSLARRRWVEQVFIDSGTGFSAVSLLLGLGYFQLPCQVHIVSMTGQERAEFLQLVEQLTPEFRRLMQRLPGVPDFRVLHPPVGRSFGSVPSVALAEVQAFAQRESILVDPLYTAKLSLTYQQHRDPGCSAMMFVSGGVRELLVFQRPLREWLGEA